MRTKGVNALEMVFAMFILIVVTLVIIRLFSKTVSENTLPDIKEFKRAYGYEQEIGKCKSACRAYTEAGGCQDLAAAVDFCQLKVKIDIDGNSKVGEKGHQGLIANVPYCEDGLYCFHVDDQCSCGSMSLDAAACLRIMEDYYKGQLGLPDSTSNQIILNAIQPGQCEKDPTKWKVKTFENGQTFVVATLPDGTPLRADYWYTSAGYGDLKAGTTSTGTTTGTSNIKATLKCSVVESNKLSCDWKSCPSTEDFVLATVPAKDVYTPDKHDPNGNYVFGPLGTGSWKITLVCGGSITTEGPFSLP